jgi:uncharacterized protein (TIGR02302 family)
VARDDEQASPTPGRATGGARRSGERLPGLGWRLRLSDAALALEGVWPPLWPVFGILGLFVALAFFDVLPALPVWLHALVLLGFLGALGLALRRAARQMRLPGQGQALRRLERDSGLAHRPLSGLQDSLATADDPEMQALWAAHRRRLAAQVARLRVTLPRAGWARVDGYGLRAAVGLLLVIGLVGAWGDWGDRLRDAALPRLASAEPPPPASYDVWVNPPAYTGLPPRLLDPLTDQADGVTLPTGSTLLAQVQGGGGTPNLRVDTAGGEARVHGFEEVGETAWKAEVTIDGGRTLTLEQGGLPLVQWPIEVTPDAPPSVEYLQPPGATTRQALYLEYAAEDDYGLRDLTAVIARVDEPDAEPIELELILPPGGSESTEGNSYHDLTPHPWAGIEVTITLVATDAIDQIGTTEAFRTILPQRTFNHPVARDLVELRRQLTLDPERKAPVISRLGEIGDRPAHYSFDTVVGLAIGLAERRLMYDRSGRAVGQVQELLWETALRLEDGDLSLAERDLRELQRQLQEALANDASDEEIERLTRELQEALDRFLEALAEQAMEEMRNQDGEQMEMGDLPPDAQIMRREDFQRMLDQMQEMAKSGAREQAQQMLQNLQNMLENLQANPFQQRMSEQARQAQQMMQNLETLARRQQELLDRSFQRSQQGQQREQRQQMGETGDGEGRENGRASNAGDAEAQEALRRALGELMRQMGDMTGEIPQPLGQAEQSMRAARDALQNGAPGQAMGPQADAVDQLQQGLETMLEQMAQQLGGGEGQEGTQTGMNPGESRDPFGRGQGGNGEQNREDVQIPDEMELQRAREILEELRRRSGERFRSPLELDYIERLLEQF